MYKNLLTILLVYTTGLSLQAQNPIIAFPSITVDESEEFDIDVTVSAFNSIVGMQFTIQWDPAKLYLLEVTNFNLPDLDISQFGNIAANLDLGKLPVLWDDDSLLGVSVPDGTVIYTLRMQATGIVGDTIPLKFATSPASTELVDNGLNPLPVTEIEGVVIYEDIVGTKQIDKSNIQSLINYPNPFTDFTTIGFDLQETTKATLIITDLTGKEIYRETEKMNSGYHQKKIASTIFPSTGEYIYYIQTNSNQLLEKMIFAK